MPHSDSRRRLTDLPKLLGVAAIYALLARTALIFPDASGFITVIWPASGLALAALMAGGKRYAWSVFFGALLTYTMMGKPLGVSLVVSMGNTLEALLGAWLVTHDGRFDPRLRSLRDYLRLILMGGAGSIVAALIGATALLISGLLPRGTLFLSLAHWWMGDALGIILITPLILVWRLAGSDRFGTRRASEAVLLFGMAFLVGQTVFFDWFHDSLGQVTRGYWMFLFIAWVAVRLGTRGTAVALVMTAVQALLGAYYGTGFFADDIATTHLTNYWFYMAILSVVGMALATYFTERGRAEEALRQFETRKLRTLYDSTSDAVILMEETRLIDCNQAALAMFGCATREEFCSMRPADLSPPEQACGMNYLALSSHQAAIATEKGSHRFEWTHRRLDNGQIFFAEVLLCAMNLEGKPVLQAAVRDITERKQAEATLRRNEENLNRAQTIGQIGSWHLDIPAGRMEWSAEIYRMFGIPQGSAIDLETFVSAVHHEDRDFVFGSWGKAMDGMPYDIEYRIIAGGRTRWVREYAQIERDSAGRLLAGIGTVQDITERKGAQLAIDRLNRVYQLLSRVNETIVRSRDRYELFAAICKAAVESGLFRFVWIGMLDENWVIPVAHAGVEEGYLQCKFHILLDDERTGYGPTGRAIRKGAHVVCQDIEQDPAMAPWRDEAMKRGYRASAAFPIRETGGDAGAISVYAVETHFFTPDIVKLMLELAADISFSLDIFSGKERQEQAEAELKQLNLNLERRVMERTRQLEMANRELEAFSYSVSHDLRAPLRSIDGFSQILLKTCHDQLDATGRDYLQRVRRASQRMGHLIDDLLQLSQVARSSLKREPVNLSEIAEQVADELRKTNPERQVRFVLQPGLSVQADPGLLRIVLDNLLGNAWKYTGKKAEAEIEFGRRDIDGEGVFFVRDNGDGFNMDYVHKLFGTFQRLHGANEFEGTGIGLATVQRIIHRHNGRVWAEGREGEGAAFYFTLPQRERET